MPIKGFYYTYGDDSDLIEKKWLPDLEAKYKDKRWVRYDATIDDLQVGNICADYYANNIFDEDLVLVIRNSDSKRSQVLEIVEQLTKNPLPNNVVILLGAGLNKTTKLGKLISKSFMKREFTKPELKPFDLLDSLNMKSSSKVLHQSNRLFDTGYNPLAMFSLIFGHFLILRQIKERETKSPEAIAREIHQHQFRVKKAMVAMRFWNKADIDKALLELSKVDSLIRTWQYDEKMLLQMLLINLCI